jgi:hypothetical protein
MKNLFTSICILLIFYKVNAQTNTFPSSGNVGIGTTSPQYNLQVNGVTQSSKYISDDSYDHIELTTNSWGGSHGIFFGSTVNYSGTGNLWQNYGNTKYASDPGAYNYGASSIGYIANGGGLTLYDGGISTGKGNSIIWTPALTVARGGNVGIGTTSPGIYKLLIQGDGSNNIISGVYNPSTTNGAGLMISDNINNYTWKTVPGSSGSMLTLGYANNTAEFLRVSYNGFVGIGTTNPTQLLSVAGNIQSKKLIVTQSGWSDYVFKPSYHLKSLSELATFIKANKHLPDIPSTKEVEKDGIDVGATEALLLKKIEELTLYMIDQNKRMDALSKENLNLKKRIEKIENHL